MDKEKSVDFREALVAEGPALLEIRGFVGHLQLNQPESANCLNIEMLEALHAVLRLCIGEPRIRVLLLSGLGPHFCAGGDVHTFAAQKAQLPNYVRRATALLQEVIATLIHLDAPVVTAVQGYTAGGGGMGLMCASDLVIATQSAKFLAGATRVGMAPDAGLSVTLPRLVGVRKATELLMLNLTLTADEALALGLINQVVADDALPGVAFACAEKLAAGAPLALSATKRLLWAGVNLSVDAAMPEESRTVADLCHSGDVHEGLMAVIEKRPARFLGK